MFDPQVLKMISPASLQDILDAIAESVVVVSDRLEIVASNEAASRLFGPGVVELSGRPVCDLFGEETCPMEVLQTTLTSGQPVVDVQTEIRLASGDLGQVLLRTVVLSTLRDGGSAVAMILRDVTEVTTLRKDATRRQGYGGMIGADPQMQELYRLIEDVAPSLATVLIRGESGTGKELVARAVHFASQRADGPFVPVNCSALTETLLESELFGHVKGAFTGAVADRSGRFHQARGGTIFLDEIGDVSPVVQVKLLRVLQERVVERVGEGTAVPVDVRVVAATNRDLEDAVARGLVREDFYYRIRGVTLRIPPLRARKSDIPELVAHFLVGQGRRTEDLGEAARGILLSHDWPGNVRELEHAVEHAVVLSRGRTIRPEHLPPELRAEGRTPGLAGIVPHSEGERERILAVLESQHWHRSRTARELGIDRTTLWRKIREYGLSPNGDSVRRN